MSESKRSLGLWMTVAVAVMVMVGNAADAALPGTVSSRVKTINTTLDQAEKSLAGNRLSAAERKVADAQRTLKEINDRYAGKFAADDPDYTAAVERLAAVAAKVEAAGKDAAGAADAKKKAQADNDALCKQWIDKLGPFVDHKSDQYLRLGAELNNASPEDQAKSKAAYPKAKALFAEYQKVEFPLGEAMDLKNVESRLADLLKYYGRDEADAAQEAACQEWVDKLSPYVTTGSERCVIAAATVNAQHVKTQQALYEEAKKLFAEYQQAKFPKGKTQRLQGLEEDMAKTLAAFPKAMAESQAMMSGDVGKRLDGILEYMGRDTAWKDDASKKPPTVMARDLDPLREEVAKFAGTVKPDDPKLAELQAKLKAVETKDAEHRAVRAKRTFQSPDGFAGSETDALKAKAKDVAASAYPKGSVLRVTVPSKDWAIEDVVEHTDTTATALRHRITRSVRSQVVAKDVQGTLWLQEVYLGQDKLPDGGWGSLNGHTTWADPRNRCQSRSRSTRRLGHAL